MLALHGVLPSLAGGEGPGTGRCDLYAVMDGPYRLPCQTIPSLSWQGLLSCELMAFLAAVQNVHMAGSGLHVNSFLSDIAKEVAIVMIYRSTMLSE